MGLQRGFVSSDRRFKKPPSGVDHGTLERWQHSSRIMEITERAGVLAARAGEENILDVLLARGWIGAVEREAGMKFRLDYHMAGLEVRVVGSYSPARGGVNNFSVMDERTDAEEAAYQRWRNAMRVLGPALNDLVMTVACHDQWPASQQTLRVKRGLMVLAKWYRVQKTEGR
ncbi:MAG: DUF6456 domain-containing protein [Alphaproteobacteria bacterium]|nr:DUF6456 domain-containing protein [Alphaproteobacteria bacterium]